MLQLNLIRHAKTETQSNSGRDFDRELMPKGREQAEILAAFLQENGIQLGNVFCSTAARTKETFRPHFRGLLGGHRHGAGVFRREPRAGPTVAAV